MQAADTPDVVRMAIRWSRLNLIRHALVLAACLAALRAFELATQKW